MATGQTVNKRRGQTSNPIAISGRQNNSNETKHRKEEAIKRMEKSSTNSLKALNDSYSIGVETIQHLDSQAKTLHRVERRLDGMKEDLDETNRYVQPVESLFDRIVTFFSRRQEVTVPKRYSVAALGAPKKTSARSRSKEDPHYSHQWGSRVVKDNMEEMDRQLDRLEGVGMVMSRQLDDSEVQTNRIGPKMTRDEICIKKLTREIKQL